jgi:hypothetical protein
MSSKATVRGLAALGAFCVLAASGALAGEGDCGGAITERSRLLERVAHAMANRSRDRMHETFVIDVGVPWDRSFFVYLGPRDQDLFRLPRQWRPVFQPLAFRLGDWGRWTDSYDVRIVRELPGATILRVDWEAQLAFPTYSAGIIERWRLGAIPRRQDELLRRVVRRPGARPLRALEVSGPFRAELEYCLVRDAAGRETVESVSVEAFVFHENRWLRIGAGTDR